MKALELKVPPLLLVLLVGSLMWAASLLLAQLNFAFKARLIIAGCLLISGFVVILAAVVSFRRASTTVNPVAPDLASSIVTTGIYRYSRNPMYLGFLLVLAAWAVMLSHILAFVLLPAYVVYMNRYQIRPEERALKKKFGQAFLNYKASVRRWL
ncbi:methyltransferase family protein [Marinobacter salicampi]|uniref:methyltransferase family protein n=1 Tax=Marinobacter salicampi TaxID=435907 RepID=UPI001407807C|nr:isoprenylcysteine carboxylmethyltransferase family protein [Marinobacter salicampi]